MKQRLFLVLLCIGSVLFTACTSNQSHYEKSELIMDTLVTLSAYGKNSKIAVEEAFTRIEEIDHMASSENQDSDIYKINQEAGNHFVVVHPEVYKMIQTSLTYSKLTEGAFDITVGPLIKLWGIGTDHEQVPSEAEIKEALSLVSYDNILMNEKECSVMLLKRGMSIDLGAVAKGFAADEVHKIFESYDITNALINLGTSSIDTMGVNEEGKPWVVGIANPRAEELKPYLAILNTSEEAISTSGDYERFFEKDGKRYHHILDPKTGYPAEHKSMSVTIVINQKEEDCGLLSDILSTVAFVLGPEEGVQFIATLPGVSGIVTTTDKRLYTTDEFDQRLLSLNEDYQIIK